MVKGETKHIKVKETWASNDLMPHSLREKGIYKYVIKDTDGTYYETFADKYDVQDGDKVKVRCTNAEAFTKRVVVEEIL